MAITAKIKLVQGVNTPPAGQALDGVTGVVVTATNNDDTDVAFWTWTIVDVALGSSIPIGTTGSSSSFTFTPDVAGGCYLLRLVTQNSDQSRNAIFYLAVVVKDTYGRWWPPFGGDDKMVNIGGQTRGWMPAFDSYKPLLDRLRDIGPVGPTDGQTFKWVAANNRFEFAASGGGMTALTGAVTGSGSGSVVTTLSNSIVSDVNVSPTAAISLSKIAPGTAAQIPVTDAGGTAWVGVTVSGDATIAATGAVTVGKVNGTSVGAGGSLTTGQVLRATGAAAAGWGALDLANAAAVTGILPTGNQAAQSLGGVLSGTTASAAIVAGSISNTQINASAAVAVSKLAAGSDGQVLKTSGSSVVWGSGGSPATPPLLGASTIHRWLFNDAAASGTAVDGIGGADMTIQNAGNVVQGDTGLYCDSCSFTSNGFARSTNITNPSSTTLLTLHGWFKDRAFTNSFARLIGKGFVPMTSYGGTGGFNSVEIARNGTTGTIYAIWVAQTNTTKSTTQRTATGRYIVALNLWHYLAVTFSQAAGNMTVNIYLNGNLLSSEVVASAAIDWNGASAGGWCMGAVANSPVNTAAHDGWVFDWRVEDGVAMTQTQVRTHYKTGLGLSY